MRNPDHEHRVFLAHALGTFDRMGFPLAKPTQKEKQQAKHERQQRGRLKIARLPELPYAHRANVEARLGKQDKHVENPDEHRIFLKFRYLVGNFRVKVPKPESDRQRNRDDRLDGVKNRLGKSRKIKMFHPGWRRAEIAKNQRNRKAGDDATDEKDLESENRVSAEELCHHGRRVRGRTETNQHSSENNRMRKPERLFDS